MKPHPGLLLLLGAGAVLAQALPRFEDYPAEVRAFAKPPAPRWPDWREHVLGHPKGPERLERYRLDILSGPNFAGHLHVFTDTCGSYCSNVMVYDYRDGRCWELPWAPLFTSLHISGWRGRNFFQGMTYRRDSRLLIADGCFDDDRGLPVSKDCGTRYYVWTAGRLTLIRYDRERELR